MVFIHLDEFLNQCQGAHSWKNYRKVEMRASFKTVSHALRGQECTGSEHSAPGSISGCTSVPS